MPRQCHPPCSKPGAGLPTCHHQVKLLEQLPLAPRQTPASRPESDWSLRRCGPSPGRGPPALPLKKRADPSRPGAAIIVKTRAATRATAGAATSRRHRGEFHGILHQGLAAQAAGQAGSRLSSVSQIAETGAKAGSSREPRRRSRNQKWPCLACPHKNQLVAGGDIQQTWPVEPASVGAHSRCQGRAGCHSAAVASSRSWSARWPSRR